MKKLTILLLVVSLIALLYGCCSHSSDAVFVKPQGDTIVTSREVIIDELGRLPTVTFPSGARIEGLEENTMTPGIVVTIAEQKTTQQNNSYFNDSKSDGIYLYKITAYQNVTNIAGGKAYVTTTEKPLKITLPKTQNSQGIALASIKESDTDPWRLFNFSDSDEILANIAEIKASQTAPKECTFNLFRLGIQFALVSYGGNAGNKLLETYVTALNASSTPSILVKDGKYLEDLTIKGIIKGVKLDSIKPTDLRARITYRNNLSDEASIKVNGNKVTQTNKADKTVPGYTYCHSFLIDSMTESNLMGIEGEFTFILNLDGIETKRFSSGFLIEFFNRVDSEKILPYNYTEFYTLKQVGIYNIAYDLDGGVLAEPNPATYTEDTETFVLNEPTKEGYIFLGWTGTSLDSASMTLSIPQGSSGDRTYTANWSAVAYSISYELNGGTLAEVNPDGYNFASETFVLNEPIKDGYTFIGWTGSNGDTPQKHLSIVQGSKSDLSFVANYAPITYNIEYVLNDSSLPQGLTNPASYDITSATITLNNPIREGYTLVGWSGTGLIGNNNLTVSIEQGSMGDRIYTANWSAVAYSISYELNGGTLAEANPDGYNFASETFVLNEPTKEGYTFIGWTGTGLNTASKTLFIVQGSKSNLNFTANWSINSYRLDLVKSTGINTVSGDGLHEYNSVVNASCTMLDGYEFDSWSGDLTTETFNMPASNAIMTAKARPISYNIVYNLDGGTANNTTSYDITSATIVLNEPIKEGYTFLGWTGSNGNTPEKPLSIVQGSKSDLSFVAKYAPIAYNVEYVLNDGIVATPNPTNYDITSAAITLNNPSKDYYSFLGWTGSNGNVPQATVTIANGSIGNKEFTANYAPIAYNIEYILNDGSLPQGLTNPTSYDITSATITLNNPTKSGYFFTGWTEGIATFPLQFTQIPQGSTVDKSYTAHWIEVKTFNLPNDVTLVMHKIPAGVFTMGSPTDELGRRSNETQHQVTLTKDFYIGRFEVTQDQYFAVMGTNPSHFKDGAASSARPTTSANYPVENVNYNNITTANTGFLAKINTQVASQLPSGYKFDLPTEAQWEYACRAGTVTSLNSNKNLTSESVLDSKLSEVAWHNQVWNESQNKTHTVGQKRSNAWGLYDMHGNVSELCKDWYNSNYYATCGDCTDPFCNDSSSYRVMRGGSWQNDASMRFRSACRETYPTSYTYSPGVGFRLVLVEE